MTAATKSTTTHRNSPAEFADFLRTAGRTVFMNATPPGVFGTYVVITVAPDNEPDKRYFRVTVRAQNDFQATNEASRLWLSLLSLNGLPDKVFPWHIGAMTYSGDFYVWPNHPEDI